MKCNTHCDEVVSSNIESMNNVHDRAMCQNKMGFWDFGVKGFIDKENKLAVQYPSQ